MVCVSCSCSPTRGLILHISSSYKYFFLSRKKRREESYEHLDIQEENISLHTDTTDTGDENSKEFLHLPLWVTVRATWKCDFLSNSSRQMGRKKSQWTLVFEKSWSRASHSPHELICCFLTGELTQTRQSCLAVSYFGTMGLPRGKTNWNSDWQAPAFTNYISYIKLSQSRNILHIFLETWSFSSEQGHLLCGYSSGGWVFLLLILI